MNNKIIKYKLKKNKLEEKIINILNLKKEDYENEIINSNDNEIITTFVENFFDKFKYNKYENLIIIIFGEKFVGKTTFINHLVNYIKILENIYNTENKIDLIKNHNLNNKIDNLKDICFSSKITIIECNYNNIDEINLFVQNSNVINIEIIPKNKNLLKNKICNKIIFDIVKKSNDIINFIKNIICQEEVHNIINQINLLKKKKSILNDNDFDFLDKIIDIYYDKIINKSKNYFSPLNTQKYYL